MQRRILSLIIIAFLSFSFINWGCSKLDTTDIGSDLLPAVDNVHTFADTLSVITTQSAFNPDTNAVIRTDDHVFGKNNDPLFGSTTANMFFQLKPRFFPFYFGNYDDTLNGFGAGLDSVVLCLSYKGFYGDSTSPVHIEVREVTDTKFRDSPYIKRTVNTNVAVGQLLGSANVDTRRMADTIHYTHGTDYAINQIRIKLSPSNWANNLYNSDTVLVSGHFHAFKTDSAYRRFFNGLAVIATSGNQLVYTNLADAATKLEIHFRHRNKGRIDTTYTSMVLNSDPFGSPTFLSSATANYIQRNRPVLPSGSQEIYLQTTPGTYANLSIPALSGMSNRIIHRAELIVQQIPETPVSVFKTPNFLYLDLLDSGTTSKWKPIYHDLNPNAAYDPDYKNPLSIPYYPSANIGIDYLYFGGYRRDKTDQFGNAINYYNFNITRYVQDIVTRHRYNYNLRLFSPSKFDYPQYSAAYLNYGNSIAYGRVKVGGGNNANYRLILRVVYSNL